MREVESIKAVEKTKVTLDPKGFFVIFIKGDEIIAEHYINVNKGGKLSVETGKINKVIHGTSAKAICDAIISEGLVSRFDHMAYISRELQKAEIAMKLGKGYEQSHDLDI